jgi:hypothetical protein
MVKFQINAPLALPEERASTSMNHLEPLKRVVLGVVVFLAFLIYLIALYAFGWGP